MPSASPASDLADSVLTIAGRATFDRGRRYAVRGMVTKLEWDADDSVLFGRVRGSRGMSYSTSAYIGLDGPSPAYLGGECTCPVAIDCKHSVALTLQGTAFLLSQARPPAPPAWDEVLAEALGPPARTQHTPLAVRISTTPGSAPRYSPQRAGLYARVMRPGKNGDWINGSLTWPGIGLLGPEYSRTQKAALTEIHRLHRAAAPYSGADRDLFLPDIDSPALWDALARARRAGVAFIHAAPALGPVADPLTADVVVDVTRTADGGRTVLPMVRIDGAATVPLQRLGAIGRPPHGMYALTEPGAPDPIAFGADAPALAPEQCEIRLLRMESDVPEALWSLLGEGTGTVVPPQDLHRFTTEFGPRLAEIAPVLSSDDSFHAPTVSGPLLQLHARFGGEPRGAAGSGTEEQGDPHALRLVWMWQYTIGDGTEYFALHDPAGSTVRDVAAESSTVAALEAAVPFGQYGLGDSLSGRLAASTVLRSADTMRAATELLPLLQSRDDVEVVIEGDAPEYRDAGDRLRIAVAADEDDDPQTDWFDLSVRVTVEGTEVPLAVLIGAIARDETHLLLDDGRYISLDKPELRRLRSLIEEARALQDTPSEKLKISRFQAGLWEELAALGVVERQAQAWQRQVQGLLDLDDVRTHAPARLDAELRGYQLDGYRWLEFLWRNRLGGILADDMGLGKTVQVLALLCRAREAAPGDPPVLILAPSSVVPNWAAEAERFTPHLRVAVVGETSRKRGTSLAQVLAAAEADVLITSYTLFRLDFDEHDAAGYSALVMDEAQFAKNHQSKLYHCARRLGAPVKIAMTGTPMENNLMELWSLLSITAPGLFPSPRRFTEYYRRPIERGGDAELLAQLRRRVRPLMLRRRKEQVVRDLPDKQEQILEVPLNAKHRHVYDAHLKREQQKILGLLGDVDKNRFEIFRSLTLLRRLCLDVSLVDAQSTIPSAKIDALLEHLTELVARGHKALVFSQFTSFLTLVRGRLDAAGIESSYLDGKTRNRARAVSEFTSGATPVFLISLKAGGFGLNLTEADYCFILDPWWNPATEQQAVDRAHRIGQTRNVMVYRLISSGTIEDKVMALKERKAELVSGVLDDGGGMSTALDAADIRALLE